jgi:hypothetical protein
MHSVHVSRFVVRGSKESEQSTALPALGCNLFVIGLTCSFI